MKDVFTVIILHYNQKEYIFNAIDSVLKQDYPNIELLITDDCSKEFPKKEIEKYIEENKGENIKKLDFVINSENVGTIKTVNKVVKKSTGKYLTFFAADDELNNNTVISEYEKAFKKYNKKIITGQCYEYDNQLKVNKGEFVNSKIALENNKKNAIELYIEMVKACLYASGSTAYDTSIFDDYGYFDERYKLVEDWTYWLFILKKGVMIHYIDYPILNHRSGGVSHYESEDLPPHVKTYFEDLLLAVVNEVLIDLPKNISDIKKLEIYKRVNELIDYYTNSLKCYNKKSYYQNQVEKSMEENINNLKIAKIKSKLYNFYKWHIYLKIKNFHKSNRLFFSSIVIWIILNLFMNNVNILINSNLTYLVVSFLISSLIADILMKIGDYAIFCAPATVITTSIITKFIEIESNFVLILLMIVIYAIIYYLYFFIRLLNRKMVV